MLPGYIVRSEGYKWLSILGRGDRNAWKAPRSPVLQCFSDSSQKVVETLHRESLILPVPVTNVRMILFLSVRFSYQKFCDLHISVVLARCEKPDIRIFPSPFVVPPIPNILISFNPNSNVGKLCRCL